MDLWFWTETNNKSWSPNSQTLGNFSTLKNSDSLFYFTKVYIRMGQYWPKTCQLWCFYQLYCNSKCPQHIHFCQFEPSDRRNCFFEGLEYHIWALIKLLTFIEAAENFWFNRNTYVNGFHVDQKSGWWFVFLIQKSAKTCHANEQNIERKYIPRPWVSFSAGEGLTCSEL